MAEAFAHYADEEGVIKRDTLYKGKDAIFSFYDKTSQEGVNLTWTPEFVDISESGDMAYTYGLYTYTFPDSLGNTSSTTGIFHTIWKRQADGTWRFVWD
ncbi:MAG: nuclear transport factor 2 family protein [Flammeovirgaceae bacterium]|nr:nuclear transport factor 2 family protein [Flammeovirgaceae bacterium]